VITPHIELLDLYDRVDRYAVTWQLLVEREDWVNITHRQMPTRQEHEAFVDSKPYEEPAPSTFPSRTRLASSSCVRSGGRVSDPRRLRG
jgi:hypothetical protein